MHCVDWLMITEEGHQESWGCYCRNYVYNFLSNTRSNNKLWLTKVAEPGLCESNLRS